MRKIVALLTVALLALLAVVPAFAQLGEEEIPEGSGFIRVAHMSPDAPPVVIFVNEEIVLSGLPFGRITRWVALEPGTYSVAVSTDSDIANAVIGPVDIEVAEGSFTTVAAVGTVGNESLKGSVIAEDYSPLGTGQARLTVFHAIEGAPLVDVTANGGTLVNALAFPGTIGDNDGYATLEVPAGTYDVSVVATDLGPVIYNNPELTLDAGSNYFVVAAGTPDEPQVFVAATNQSDYNVAREYGEGSARVRVAHLSPDAPPVVVFVNGEPVLSGLRFGRVTRFLDLAPGTYEIAVGPNSSIANAVIGPVDLTFEDGTFTTIAALGSLEDGTLQPSVIADCAGAEAGNACVTVIHGIEDAPAVDVVAIAGEEEITLVEAIAFPGTFQLPAGGFNDGVVTFEAPAGSYTLEVRPNGSSAAVLSADATLQEGFYYLAVAAGLLGDGSATLILEETDPANLDPQDF